MEFQLCRIASRSILPTRRRDMLKECPSIFRQCSNPEEGLLTYLNACPGKLSNRIQTVRPQASNLTFSHMQKCPTTNPQKMSDVSPNTEVKAAEIWISVWRSCLEIDRSPGTFGSPSPAVLKTGPWQAWSFAHRASQRSPWLTAAHLHVFLASIVLTSWNLLSQTYICDSHCKNLVTYPQLRRELPTSMELGLLQARPLYVRFLAPASGSWRLTFGWNISFAKRTHLHHSTSGFSS